MDNWIAVLKSYPPSPALLEIFGFLDRESQAIDLEYNRICSQPVEQRLANGDTLGPLTLLGDYPDAGDVYLELFLEEDHSRFREGDEGYLGPPVIGAERISAGVPVTYVQFDRSRQRLRLRIDPMALDRLPLLRENAAVQPHFFDARKMDLSNLYAQAAIQALDTPNPSPLVLALTGQAHSCIKDDLLPELLNQAVARGLDASQAEAFCELARFPLGLVQGPPGTGKTWVLGHVVAHLLDSGCRVLVCAMSHRAINQALNTCARILTTGSRSPSHPVLKIGQPWQAMKLDDSIERVPNARTLAAMPGVLSGPLLVGTSLARVPGLASKNMSFDVVVVDEAGQITLPQALCAAVAAPRALFFGDHKQLPPIILAEHPPSPLGLTSSAFEALANRHTSTMLTVSYRLNAALAAFPSNTFYDGRLHASPKSAQRRLQLARAVSSYVEPLLDPATPLVWAEVSWAFEDLPNEAEACLVAACVRAALIAGVPSEEIGIISPFRIQNTAIRRALQHVASGGPPSLSDIVVDTVERMQGQERELIIISFALCDPKRIAQQADFIYSPNRLNVAVTRAKTKCIVLGHPSLLRPWDASLPAVRGAQLFQQLVAHAAQVPITAPTVRAIADEIGYRFTSASSPLHKLFRRVTRRFRT